MCYHSESAFGIIIGNFRGFYNDFGRTRDSQGAEP